MWINLDDFLIVSDYARHINKTVSWTNQLIREKKIPFILHNNRKLIPKSGELPDYITNQELANTNRNSINS